jgi:radical SAM superfamily enzyme YgiQ (UPF0313 family)
MPNNSIYLINPRDNYPGYHGMEVLRAWDISKKTGFADLTTPTVAGLIPKNWDVTICDERVEPVDLDHKAEIIGITGKVLQRGRMAELAREFRIRGKTVLIGGPHASLDPDDCRPLADILVKGELESIAAELFADIEAGTWKREYDGGRPDLRESPLPRWDLCKRGAALIGQVQTSRGCPFECEFCDVIQYLGRKQRWKEPEQVVRELDVLYDQGFRAVFLADDNFTVMRRRTRALLERLVGWNAERTLGRVRFSSQVSIDLARDPELIALCVRAGFRGVFIGVETPNKESLVESMKRQNVRVDLAAEVRTVVEAGLLVTCGMIVGFDHDGPDIFERQADFIANLPTPLITLSLLVAPAATPLYDRMKQEDRLITHDPFGAGYFLTTNIQPKLMTVQQLRVGAQWLLNRIFSPSEFGRRLQAFADTAQAEAIDSRSTQPTLVEKRLSDRLASLGSEEIELVNLIWRLIGSRPELHDLISYCLLYYCQTRYLLDLAGLWDPGLARENLRLVA